MLKFLDAIWVPDLNGEDHESFDWWEFQDFMIPAPPDRFLSIRVIGGPNYRISLYAIENNQIVHKETTNVDVPLMGGDTWHDHWSFTFSHAHTNTEQSRVVRHSNGKFYHVNYWEDWGLFLLEIDISGDTISTNTHVIVDWEEFDRESPENVWFNSGAYGEYGLDVMIFEKSEILWVSIFAGRWDSNDYARVFRGFDVSGPSPTQIDEIIHHVDNTSINIMGFNIAGHPNSEIIRVAGMYYDATGEHSERWATLVIFDTNIFTGDSNIVGSFTEINKESALHHPAGHEFSREQFINGWSWNVGYSPTGYFIHSLHPSPENESDRINYIFLDNEFNRYTGVDTDPPIYSEGGWVVGPLYIVANQSPGGLYGVHPDESEDERWTIKASESTHTTEEYKGETKLREFDRDRQWREMGNHMSFVGNYLVTSLIMRRFTDPNQEQWAISLFRVKGGIPPPLRLTQRDDSL